MQCVSRETVPSQQEQQELRGHLSGIYLAPHMMGALGHASRRDEEPAHEEETHASR